MIRALVSVGGYYEIRTSNFVSIVKMLLIGQRACFVILAYIKVYIYNISTIRGEELYDEWKHTQAPAAGKTSLAQQLPSCQGIFNAG